MTDYTIEFHVEFRFRQEPSNGSPIRKSSTTPKASGLPGVTRCRPLLTGSALIALRTP